MNRWRMFRNSVKAIMFCMWCEDHGIKVTGQKILGAAVEVDYVSTDEQEALIPAAFKKM